MSGLTGVSNMREIVNQPVQCDRPSCCCSLAVLLQEVCKSNAQCQTEDKHFMIFGIGGLHHLRFLKAQLDARCVCVGSTPSCVGFIAPCLLSYQQCLCVPIFINYVCECCVSERFFFFLVIK